MSRFVATCGVVICLLCCAVSAAGDEVRVIPLSEIITTSPQKGLQHVREARIQTNGKWDPEVFLQQIHNVSKGGSNTFIVDATNLYDALSASLDALTGPRRVDAPVLLNRSEPERGSFWLVAYLGSGPSNPTWWAIDSVAVEKDKVVLAYHETKPRPATDDERHYYYWIPLGKLDPGAYEVQLFDSDK
ncbi:MAG: hypothetical protein AB7I57_16830, partial [Pirellulales bacterium]